MATVTVIQPITATETNKLRVAAYCRVSSSSEDQLNSYQAQLTYYSHKFEDSDTEELVDLYAANANPSLLESGGEVSSYNPNSEITRQQNEIYRMMDSNQIDYDRTKAEILRLAEMKYACCTYSDAPQKTELLKSLLAEQSQLDTLNIGLLKSCVLQILVSHFCTIEVKFINGTVIQNITERSILHDHSIECQSDSCTTADG